MGGDQKLALSLPGQGFARRRVRRLSQGGDSLLFALEHSFASAAGVFAPAARSFGLVSAGVESPSAARLERVSQLELLFCRRASSAGFGSRLRPPSPFWSSSVPLEDTGPEHASSRVSGAATDVSFGK